MSQNHSLQHNHIVMVTTNTVNRMPFFKNPLKAEKAVDCLYRIQDLHPFLLYGFVIMPDHCHFLLRAYYPESVSRVMNCYKSLLRYELHIPKLWQRRFYITAAPDPLIQLRYIHKNPVKAGLSATPELYPWSSASERYKVSRLPI